MPFIRIATVFAIAACLLASPALAQDSSQRSITVTGTATITAPNDTSGFITGVDVRRSSPGEALRRASALMKHVIGALERSGVAPADIRTQRVDVHRIVRGHPRVVAYVATNTVTVTVRSIQRTGTVIDAAVAAGANRLSGPSFWRSRTGDLYQQALVRALRKARAKAQALATDAQETLGAVQSISESGADVQTFSDSAGTRAPSAATPVQPGRTTVTAELTAVFVMT